jgi:uncharacterized membrane protein
VRLFRIRHRLGSSLWFVPLLCVLAGAALSTATVAVDRAWGDLVPEGLTGGPDAAMEILSTVAASMVNLAVLVLTITMVVVQLAMGQFSPRIVRSILSDRPSQLAIGIFVGTFVHAILAQREVRLGDGQDPGFVPGLSVVVAFVLVVVSIMALVLYVHHIGQSLRVAALIELVGEETRRLIDRLYPSAPGAPGHARGEDGVIATHRSGVVFAYDKDGLVEFARREGCVLELLPSVGDFVPAGAPLFRVHGASLTVEPGSVERYVDIGPERTMTEDVAYGFRMLVDIAERGLSEPFLDPTTAVQAIDRLHDGLRQLAPRPFPDGRHRDAGGAVRLIVPTLTWEGYVRLAFDELRVAGAASPQVPRRLRAALEDLLTVAPDDRRPPLLEQLALLDEANPADPARGADPRADRQGIGSAGDLLARASADGAGR